ncbi:MAG: hypothetical protein ACRDO1_02610 [Nocardioidaceae bacterium]
MTDSWVAVDACTLPTVEQPLRVAEFDALFAQHVVKVERLSPTRLGLLLSGPEGLAGEVTDLTDRETACCSFFTFTVSAPDDGQSEAGRLRLDIEVPAARADVLTALAERAEPARGGTQT